MVANGGISVALLSLLLDLETKGLAVEGGVPLGISAIIFG
jgi:hypothetical protein